MKGNREYRLVQAKRDRMNEKYDDRLFALEEKPVKQNKELSTQADELKGKLFSLKKEILSHASRDDQLITQYISSQTAYL
jgi:hypothetical protein